jgi:hypothetical protein
MNQVQEITFQVGDIWQDSDSGDNFTVVTVFAEHITVAWSDGLEWSYPTKWLASHVYNLEMERRPANGKGE